MAVKHMLLFAALVQVGHALAKPVSQKLTLDPHEHEHEHDEQVAPCLCL